MAIKKTYFAILVIMISISCYSFQCNKSIDCTENVYSFELGVKASPDNDSISVGDTLWLEVDALTTLKDIRSGSDINYGGAENLGSAIGFQALSFDTQQFTIEAVQNFEYIIASGTEVKSTNPNLFKEYVFAESNNRYLFKLGIVPKERGVYSIVLSNAANVYRKNDKCTKASFGLNFKNTDQHYYLNPYFQGRVTPVGGDYYFKVY